MTIFYFMKTETNVYFSPWVYVTPQIERHLCLSQFSNDSFFKATKYGILKLCFLSFLSQLWKFHALNCTSVENQANGYENPQFKGEKCGSMLERVPWFQSLHPTHRGKRDFMVLSELVAKLGRTSLCRQYAIMHMKEGDPWINPPPL